MLGPVSSTDAQAAIPAVAGAGSLACSASATVSDLNSNPPSAAFYRTALPDYETVQFVATEVVAQRDAVAPGKPWKVVIVARGDDYGTSVSSGLSAVPRQPGDHDERDHLPARADVVGPTGRRRCRPLPERRGGRDLRGGAPPARSADQPGSPGGFDHRARRDVRPAPGRDDVLRPTGEARRHDRHRRHRRPGVPAPPQRARLRVRSSTAPSSTTAPW